MENPNSINETGAVAPVNPGSSSSQIGIPTQQERINELYKAFEKVVPRFKIYKQKLIYQLIIWGLICSALVAFCVFLAYFLLNELQFPPTWQMIYFIAIRITIATALFGFATFCFKTLRSYIHLLQQAEHNMAVIESAPYLIGAATGNAQRDILYVKLINIITHLGETGLLDNELMFKLPKDFASELLSNIIKQEGKE